MFIFVTLFSLKEFLKNSSTDYLKQNKANDDTKTLVLL